MDWVFVIAGGLLVLSCLVQLFSWTSTSIRRQINERDYWKLQRQLLLAKIEAVNAQRQQTQPTMVPAATLTVSDASPALAWRGWRRFRVKHLVRETSTTTSVYLVPQDGLDLPEFKPGQFLTLKFELPNQVTPQIRCYSLSDRSCSAPHYRITVKDTHGAPLAQGGVSHYVNWQWGVGDSIDVQAPRGDFFLNPEKTEPVVLLAGGVGITPLMSMIETVLERGDRRDLLLFYGLKHGGEHVFKERLSELARTYSNFNVLNCYSSPQSDDVEGRDFHFAGRVSVDLIKRALPGPNYHFYMCGPGPFMNDLFAQLVQWGVPEDHIHFEAFGPATVKPANTVSPKSPTPNLAGETAQCVVHFARSNRSIPWNEGGPTLLDVAHRAGVPMSSGCRAGQCGSCQTKLIQGEVEYPKGHPHHVEVGHCLPCVGVPKSSGSSREEVVLDA
jgi:ferredoxin-NADP reductase